MPIRIPNTSSPSEVRQGFQRFRNATDTLEVDVTALQAKDIVLKNEIDALDTRVDVLEAIAANYSAETDSNVVAGQPIYIKANSHIGLANASAGLAYSVSGLTTEAASSGEAVGYITDGKLLLDSWFYIIGLATLTPGAIYFLAEEAGGGGAPATSYANTGGIGDRTALITITSNAVIVGNWPVLVNGAYDDSLYFSNQNTSGLYLRFDFGDVRKLITEAKWYQDIADTHGVWQWQGSDNAISWTNIGSSFTLGGTEQTQTELSGNSVSFRYYQLLGVSGTTNYLPYLREIEFKISQYVVGGSGLLTTTPPSTVGSYVVQVGRAISTTVLDIEIGPIILL